MRDKQKNKPAPKRIFAAAKKDSELELVMYDVIGGGFWNEGITSENVKAKLDEAGDVSKIKVRINSPGGSVFEASAIYSLLSQHPAEVECYVDGLAASAAFTIAMAADKIHVSDAAMMMCHNAIGITAGDASEMRKTADLLDSISAMMCGVYAKRCGMSEEEVQSLMDAETWMTAKEAVEYGFADDVITREEDDEEEEEEGAVAVARTFDMSLFANVPEQFRGSTQIAALAALKFPVAAVALAQPEIPAKPEQKEKVRMPENTAAAPVVELKANDRANEVDAILAMAKIYNQESFIRTKLQENDKLSLSDAKAMVGDAVLQSARTQTITTTESRMSVKEKKAYSIRGAILAAIPSNPNSLEREISQDLYRELRASVPGLGEGIVVPTGIRGAMATTDAMRNLRMDVTGLDTITTTAGKETVATETLSLIEYLRKNLVSQQLGMRMLTGLVANVSIPRQTAISASSWKAFRDTAVESYAAFDQVAMSPKRNTVATRYDVGFLRQSTLDAEAFVRSDISLGLAEGVDYAVFNGSGTAPVPKGVIPALGSGQKTAYNASTIYANIVAMQTALANANALKGSLAYVGTASVRGLLKQTARLANTIGMPIWDGDECDGFKALVSTNLPTTLGTSPATEHAFLFGDWSQVVFGEWGAIELIVDPYTAAAKGEYVVNASLLADIAVRHVAAFNLLTGYSG